ncbi:hypothetical protein PILCRDRAFT_733222 [Piloderma croceum F 1598]|uniref:Crinkler effector protein N-terminal domain-containing protein n=1 Tax=Piloderma croceum (strain F 1598) TaxID=765440 RepID=A0A0C3B747_PILCF|nr:hypothetical protein PILCRDRAFT_733222 [Piloderma croceum F 1598]
MRYLRHNDWVPPIIPHSGTSLDHPILELNCFVHDDDPRHVFPVKIARTESIGTLKKAIKEEKKVALEHVDAEALRLWKVSIPVNGGFKENVSRVELKDEDELSPVDTLSDVFSEVPARKHLHIIVLCSPPNAAEHTRSHPPSAFKPRGQD